MHVNDTPALLEETLRIEPQISSMYIPLVPQAGPCGAVPIGPLGLPHSTGGSPQSASTRCAPREAALPPAASSHHAGLCSRTSSSEALPLTLYALAYLTSGSLTLVYVIYVTFPYLKHLSCPYALKHQFHENSFTLLFTAPSSVYIGQCLWNGSAH